ncbi:MAG: GTP pyrophosphokinase [Burkholderiaceae bacterium]|nr:GTP pyrophosphokinase [Burkholderiaceae bacterium]
MSILEQAIALAVSAHTGQVDKAGAPYILHPLRLMLSLQTEPERIVAVLHDVVEDCGVSLEDLKMRGFSAEVVAAIEAVTRRTGESYEDFVLRAAANPIGRRVKLADLRDNSDLGRIDQPSDEERRRVEKYQRPIRLIEGQARE